MLKMLHSNAKTYKLPNIRCLNCNKPIGHLFTLFNELKDLSFTEEEVFETLGFTRYCCRKEFSTATIIPLLSCIESKMKDVAGNKYPITKKTSYEVEEIENDEKINVPLSIKSSNVIKMLNDTLYITYADSTVFLAQ